MGQFCVQPALWQHCVQVAVTIRFHLQVRKQSVSSVFWITARSLSWIWFLQLRKLLRNEQERHPLAPVTAEVPSEFEQAQHRLTHVPYKAWCPSCVAHRARVDRYERSGESHASSPPTISFDYFYTKANGEAATAQDPNTIIALVVVCSQTSFVKSIPLESKNQMEHMNREVIQFIQMLGHTDVFLRCDNEPSILQLKRLLVKTRQAMGLRTLESSAVAYDHGNSLAENAVGKSSSFGSQPHAPIAWTLGNPVVHFQCSVDLGVETCLMDFVKVCSGQRSHSI